MTVESRKEAAGLIEELLKADVKSELRFHTKTGPEGAEVTLQVPRDARDLAEHVKRLTVLMVDDAI